ncbi:hypothetical protein GBK04_28385 [Cytophagaceae bacterium SJW1-29]|uniref:Uncharacterized protein n=2 Tax=Salmonirosea aquatica TaxID=2654236 RepID=A0A7C9FFY0_9BACT|nr:hypothetical protein [Cytophagaceae bacterium SJW1-29]MPR37147.1 hypothetical protein [Cytophagaceae bacterium SJW1-29]
MVTFEVVGTGTNQIRITQKGKINLAPWQDVSGVYTTYQTGNTVRTDGLSAIIGGGVLDIRVGYTAVIAKK